MKNILKSIISLACLFAVILGGGENPDGSCCFPWTLSCLAVAILAGLALKLVFEEDTKRK